MESEQHGADRQRAGRGFLSTRAENNHRQVSRMVQQLPRGHITRRDITANSRWLDPYRLCSAAENGVASGISKTPPSGRNQPGGVVLSFLTRYQKGEHITTISRQDLMTSTHVPEWRDIPLSNPDEVFRTRRRWPNYSHSVTSPTWLHKGANRHGYCTGESREGWQSQTIKLCWQVGTCGHPYKFQNSPSPQGQANGWENAGNFQ